MSGNKFNGIVRLFRPELPFAAAVCVVLGEVIALGGLPGWRHLALGFVCGFFMSATALILNDYFDLEVDRINAPQRPLPAGLVSPGEVLVLSAITTLLGLAAGYLISPAALAVCVIFGLIGVAYNWKFKESGLPGNLMVSASTAVTFILGGLTVGQPWNPIVWVFALIAFFVDLAEEIAGDAMDMQGDKKRGSRSLAILLGRHTALRISGALFVLVILITYVPVMMGWLGTAYLVIISLTNLATAWFTVRLLNSRTPEQGRAAMRGIYLGALFGMLAAIAGQVW
jgi:geranylgeranylglycerol-phosphate geranylgeranyltransferase